MQEFCECPAGSTTFDKVGLCEICKRLADPELVAETQEEVDEERPETTETSG